MNKNILIGIGAVVAIGVIGVAYSMQTSELASPIGGTQLEGTPQQSDTPQEIPNLPAEAQPQQETTQTAPSGYTMAQVRTHSSVTSCWSAVNGKVYDLTSWVSKHPGGEKAILGICGSDGSEKFNN